MSKDLNLCTFVGRIGNDLDLRSAPNGSHVLKINLACGDDYKDKQGEKVERTNWINVVAFGKLAEIIEKYNSKGGLIGITGKLTVRKYQDKSGQDAWSTEVIVSDFNFIGGQSSDRSGNSAPSSPAPAPDADFDDDIPF